MKFAAIKNVVTSKAGRQLLTLQKHSPTILFGAGIVGVLGTVVLASRATLKIEGVLDEHTETLSKINTVESVDYDEEDRKKDTLILYIQTAGKIAKLYGPAITLGVLSIGCLTSSHHIMSQRNAGLMAAYTALDKGFRAYRERVVADIGADKDREYRYGTRDVSLVEETDEGQKIVHEKRAEGEPSIYARLFDEFSSSWNRNPEYNLVFLRSQQNYLNDKLRARGHLFLNEVYESLGLDHTKEGALVGWVIGSEGDNYVDFGLFDKEMQPQHFDFFTGRENAIWLDFNVDGVIFDKI
jgi:hypothetical protein